MAYPFHRERSEVALFWNFAASSWCANCHGTFHFPPRPCSCSFERPPRAHIGINALCLRASKAKFGEQPSPVCTVKKARLNSESEPFIMPSNDTVAKAGIQQMFEPQDGHPRSEAKYQLFNEPRKRMLHENHEMDQDEWDSMYGILNGFGRVALRCKPEQKAKDNSGIYPEVGGGPPKELMGWLDRLGAGVQELQVTGKQLERWTYKSEILPASLSLTLAAMKG